MSAPVATYRVQLGPGFGFGSVLRHVDYLDRLGVSHVYLPPILAARKGSEHGYDVVDPGRLNPELGSEDDFRSLAKALSDRNMGLLLDIVPNHMAMSDENAWWTETLAEGPAAAHARMFDIDWSAHALGVAERILLPVLGKPLSESLDAGEFSIALEDGRFWVNYFESRYPLSWSSIVRWLGDKVDPGSDAPEALDGLRGRSEMDIGDRIRRLFDTDGAFRSFAEQQLNRVCNDADRKSLETLLLDQHYRLAYWRTAVDEINYRRFFSITHLIGVNVDDPWVFDETHRLILALLERGDVTGLRIDHIDGLADPLGYLSRLRDSIERRSGYVIVEKILCGDESLPASWPVDGTTGYEFLDRVNRLFIDADGLARLRAIYAAFTGSTAPYEDIRHANKLAVIDSLFPGELASLAHMLHALAGDDPVGRDLSLHQCMLALRELTACLDVYRTYIGSRPISESDLGALSRAFKGAARRNPLVDSYSLAFLHSVLLERQDPAFAQSFIRRWQQFTGPIMAKGLEDTTHYACFPLSSLNDVGSEANHDAIDPDDFHRWNMERLERDDKSLNATSTHDTKRSEDVRARINVLSELPDWWRKAQLRWRRWNEPHRRALNGCAVPDPVFETLIYQTLVGVWPVDEDLVPDTIERVKRYLVKAARERKLHTRWIAVDQEYEAALCAFVDAILEHSAENGFLNELKRSGRRIAFWGHLNALSQVLLKIVSPGVPDIYRGTELWDLSLVDPDNRRPVDMDERERLLRDLDDRVQRNPRALLQAINRDWADGRIKLFVTSRALRCRRASPDLFLAGKYHPLHANGHRDRCICAFARQLDDQWAIAVAPRLWTRLSRRVRAPLGKPAWGDERLILRDDMPRHWQNALTSRLHDPGSAERGLPLAELLSHLPVALLVSQAR